MEQDLLQSASFKSLAADPVKTLPEPDALKIFAAVKSTAADLFQTFREAELPQCFTAGKCLFFNDFQTVRQFNFPKTPAPLESILSDLLHLRRKHNALQGFTFPERRVFYCLKHGRKLCLSKGFASGEGSSSQNSKLRKTDFRQGCACKGSLSDPAETIRENHMLQTAAAKKRPVFDLFESLRKHDRLKPFAIFESPGPDRPDSLRQHQMPGLA